MFAIANRTIARRSLAVSVRCMSQKPPASTPQPPRPQPTPQSSAETPRKDAEIPEQPVDPLAGPNATRSSLPSLDFSPEPEQEEPQRTGARSSKGSLSSGELKRRRFTRVTMALLALAFTGQAVYMGREWEDDELKAKRLKREDAPDTTLGRMTRRFSDIFSYFSDPAWPELLPPPYPPPYQKPYTLLISIDDLLVTSTWDRHHGWRTAKRPGVDYFLAYMSQFYEIVIFTTQNIYTAEPVLQKLDKYGFYITYRLYREATRTVNGKTVKDLNYLNRDLSKVVQLDTNPEHIGNPDNAIILPKWKGDPSDKGLVAMIPFLESIAIYKPADVRPVLKAYQGKNIPVEYGKRELEMKEKQIAEWRAKHKPVNPSGFGSLFGLSGSTSQPRDQPPLTYLEQKRKEAQLAYLEEQKYLEKNRAELDKMLEQDQAAMAGQVPANLWEALDQFANPKAPGAAPSSTTAPLPPAGSIPNPPGIAAAAVSPHETSEKK